MKNLLISAICLIMLFVPACGEKDDTFSIPVVSGKQLSEWINDPIFDSVPKFTAGMFDSERSQLKSGNAIMIFTEVEIADYDEYFEALTNAGLTDEFGSEGGTAIRNGRFLNEDGTIMVRLLYKTASGELTITLIDTQAEEE